VQISLVAGAGGAGTSTVAAATALRLADDGARVVLLTARPPAVAGLDAVVRIDRVKPQQALEDVWARHADALAAVAPLLTVPPASSVVPVPAVPEFAVLAALAGLAAAGDTDVVVLDAGPLATATALVALPGALRWWLAQAAPQRLRVLAGLRAAVVPGRPGGIAAALAGVAALEDLLDRVDLTDPARTAVHLVLRPEPAAAEDLCETATGLAVLGQGVASVTVARLMPAAAGEWAAQRSALQQASVAAVRDLAGDGDGAAVGPVREVAEAAVPPADVAGLRALDAAVPATPAVVVTPAAPRRDAGGWLLTVPLPFARRGEVELTRWTDDLVVTAAGQRRSLRLDPLLRRCTVAGGSLNRPGTAAASLDVRFTPDPAQWPVGMLEAEESSA
jgi:arsenite-transporting ATPase